MKKFIDFGKLLFGESLSQKCEEFIKKHPEILDKKHIKIKESDRDWCSWGHNRYPIDYGTDNNNSSRK